MKLFLFRKRYLAIPGAILAAVALCLLTNLPSYVITAAFGGGGHKGAAGATLKMSLNDAALAVEKAMLELK